MNYNLYLMLGLSYFFALKNIFDEDDCVPIVMRSIAYLNRHKQFHHEACDKFLNFPRRILSLKHCAIRL